LVGIAVELQCGSQHRQADLVEAQHTLERVTGNLFNEIAPAGDDAALRTT
jgi:hypothetical protein